MIFSILFFVTATVIVVYNLYQAYQEDKRFKEQEKEFKSLLDRINKKFGE